MNDCQFLHAVLTGDSGAPAVSQATNTMKTVVIVVIPGDVITTDVNVIISDVTVMYIVSGANSVVVADVCQGEGTKGACVNSFSTPEIRRIHS